MFNAIFFPVSMISRYIRTKYPQFLIPFHHRVEFPPIDLNLPSLWPSTIRITYRQHDTCWFNTVSELQWSQKYNLTFAITFIGEHCNQIRLQALNRLRITVRTYMYINLGQDTTRCTIRNTLGIVSEGYVLTHDKYTFLQISCWQYGWQRISQNTHPLIPNTSCL